MNTDEPITESSPQETITSHEGDDHDTAENPALVLPAPFVYYHGTAFELTAPTMTRGFPIPDFTAEYWADDKPQTINSRQLIAGDQPLLLTTLHSLDTRIGCIQPIEFERGLQKIDSDNYVAAYVTSDLPFTQNRYQRQHQLSHLIPLSDYRDRSVGHQLGVLIKQYLVLARSVFIFDRSGVLAYCELCYEIDTEPNYQEALSALESLI